MNTAGSATAARIGTGGAINGYGVLALGDVLVVERGGTEVARHRVEGLARFVAAARDPKPGWGPFPDDAEAIYLDDASDGGFGYALNLACGWCSEWGYAPFG